MANGSHASALRQIRRVFDEGTLAGLSEGQLLERFVNRLDEAAFEAILARYGPMVLGVCRRFLHQSHDIEDAFQATFLILVRRAKSLRDRDLLGHWLYGVAYRVAVRRGHRPFCVDYGKARRSRMSPWSPTLPPNSTGKS